MILVSLLGLFGLCFGGLADCALRMGVWVGGFAFLW